MFGKLKEKLKGALSIFSRKTEEVSEEKSVAEEKSVVEEKSVAEDKWKNVEVKAEKFSQKKGKEEKEREKIKKEAEHISSSEVCITYFVHGTTIDNEKGLATGWNHGELSATGTEQSKQLKEKIKGKIFNAVFCSDLKRAVDSAEITFGKEVPIFQDRRIRECNYGDLNGKKAELFKSNLKEYIKKQFPSGESYLEVEQRVTEFLNFLYENYAGKRIAIVAHQAPQLAFDVLLKGKTWEQAIDEDWRLMKKWQPGWEYLLTSKISIQEQNKKNFFGKLKDKFTFSEESKENHPEKVKKEELKEKNPEHSEGFFSKVKEKLTTKIISAKQFEELFWDLELALLENNVAVEVIERMKEDLQRELVDKPLPRKVEEKITETLKQTIDALLTFEKKDLVAEISKKKKEKKPYVIALFGINGAGKTTSVAKLSYYLQCKNFSVVWAASDTFRAAAIQQLQEHAQKLNIKVISHDYGSDAAAVAFDAVKYAEKNNIDVVFIDTAGRLHSNINLMDELEKIIRVAKPDLKLFVGESITGNDCIEQAKSYQQLTNLDGIILTKADVDEKGGAPLSVSYVIKKPILFLGVGQRYEDLEEFAKEKMLERLGL